MKTLLVTGGCGFIASHLIIKLLNEYESYHIVNMDSLTYAANKETLCHIENNKNYTFIKGSITDAQLVTDVFKEYEVDGVFHLAAESHVDNSITGPGIFIQTNINGTFNLLEAAKKQWLSRPFKPIEKYKASRFLHVSTDEVYGSLGQTGLFTESTPYAPNSPYSASKASSDFLVRSYNKTYGLNTVITNCSNNYGPHQHSEKLIPTIIRKALSGEPIPIYGDGENIRDWLYVTDHCSGIDRAFHQGKSGETYNIGGKNERKNLEIAEMICTILDKKRPQSQSYKRLVTFVDDRAGHDRRYAIDASKIETTLGWEAQETFESGVEKTVDWYIQHYMKSIKNAEKD